MYEKMEREELEANLDNEEEITLIEVLEEKEYNRSHIEGAINIPLADIGREIKGKFDLDRKIVVYCADSNCQASPRAAEKLDQLGFTNVYDYEGGKKDWREAGNPMTAG